MLTLRSFLNQLTLRLATTVAFRSVSQPSNLLQRRRSNSASFSGLQQLAIAPISDGGGYPPAPPPSGPNCYSSQLQQQIGPGSNGGPVRSPGILSTKYPSERSSEGSYSEASYSPLARASSIGGGSPSAVPVGGFLSYGSSQIQAEGGNLIFSNLLGQGDRAPTIDTAIARNYSSTEETRPPRAIPPIPGSSSTQNQLPNFNLRPQLAQQQQGLVPRLRPTSSSSSASSSTRGMDSARGQIMMGPTGASGSGSSRKARSSGMSGVGRRMLEGSSAQPR